MLDDVLKKEGKARSVRGRRHPGRAGMADRRGDEGAEPLAQAAGRAHEHQPQPDTPAARPQGRQRDHRDAAAGGQGRRADDSLSWCKFKAKKMTLRRVDRRSIISRYVLDRVKLAWRAASFHPPLRTDVRRIRGSLAILASIF